MLRRRRCAFDSDNIDEYLSIIGKNKTNLFYDEKQLRWVKGLKQIDDNEYTQNQIEGFEHNNCQVQNDYINTSELPPEIHLKSNEEVFTHHIMILGDINECLKQSLSVFCMQSRKNSNEDISEELISPLKNKLCLDLAIKSIQERDGVHLIKFLIHDISISDYAPIINVYFLQTAIYILAFDIDNEDFNAQKEEAMISYINQRTLSVKNIYSIYFTDSEFTDKRSNKFYCNRWNIAAILSQIIEQVISQ